MRLCIAMMGPVEKGGRVILQEIRKDDSDVAIGTRYGVASFWGWSKSICY